MRHKEVFGRNASNQLVGQVWQIASASAQTKRVKSVFAVQAQPQAFFVVDGIVAQGSPRLGVLGPEDEASVLGTVHRIAWQTSLRDDKPRLVRIG